MRSKRFSAPITNDVSKAGDYYTAKVKRNRLVTLPGKYNLRISAAEADACRSLLCFK